MGYQIEWEKRGAVKYFTGTVSSRDLVSSEEEVSSHSNFTAFRFVISVYLMVEGIAFDENARKVVRALRLGGYLTNPHIKYAMVTQNPTIARNVQNSVLAGETLHETAVFSNFVVAVLWVNK